MRSCLHRVFYFPYADLVLTGVPASTTVARARVPTLAEDVPAVDLTAANIAAAAAAIVTLLCQTVDVILVTG